MFKIKFKFNENFHTEARHIISMAKYETDSFIAAVFIIEALACCCQYFYVQYNTHTFRPQKWAEFVKQNNCSDVSNTIFQPKLF